MLYLIVIVRFNNAEAEPHRQGNPAPG